MSVSPRSQVRNPTPNASLHKAAQAFIHESLIARYSYGFEWLGRPIIQYPQDIMAIQELVWATRPDLIIETGVAHGGSLILSASLLALLDMCDAIDHGTPFDPRQSSRCVLGIDVDIRSHNRDAIEAHPLASRIDLIQGSSISGDTISIVRKRAKEFANVMVLLDSNHTHDHVLTELYAYAPLVTLGNYCVVFDTIIEDVPATMFPNRPWGPGNNPKTAVAEFLSHCPDFTIDKDVDNKLSVSVAPDGYLKRVCNQG